MGKKAASLPTGQSQYQIVGRYVPNEKYPEENAMCKVYRMNLFAKNKVVARSRFWYFMARLCRVKKANGQILSVSQVPAAPRAPRWRQWPIGRPQQRCRLIVHSALVRLWFGPEVHWPSRGWRMSQRGALCMCALARTLTCVAVSPPRRSLRRARPS